MAWISWALATIGCVSTAALLGVAVLAWRVRNVSAALRSAGRLPSSFDSRLNALAERQDACEALLQKIDARDRMRKVRAARQDDGAVPDPHREPEAWKAYMRAARARGN